MSLEKKLLDAAIAVKSYTWDFVDREIAANLYAKIPKEFSKEIGSIGIAGLLFASYGLNSLGFDSLQIIEGGVPAIVQQYTFTTVTSYESVKDLDETETIFADIMKGSSKLLRLPLFVASQASFLAAGISGADSLINGEPTNNLLEYSLIGVGTFLFSGVYYALDHEPKKPSGLKRKIDSIFDKFSAPQIQPLPQSKFDYNLELYKSGII